MLEDRLEEVKMLSFTNIPYDKCPKYACHELTNAQIEEIVQRVAEKAAHKAAHRAVELIKVEAYTATGSFVITKVGYVVGFLLLGIGTYLLKMGIIDIK